MKKFFSKESEQKHKCKHTEEELENLEQVFSRFCQENVSERESHLFDHLLETTDSSENKNFQTVIKR